MPFSLGNLRSLFDPPLGRLKASSPVHYQRPDEISETFAREKHTVSSTQLPLVAIQLADLSRTLENLQRVDANAGAAVSSAVQHCGKAQAGKVQAMPGYSQCF
eukprot:5740144-Amphidinium_carterae.1